MTTDQHQIGTIDLGLITIYMMEEDLLPHSGSDSDDLYLYFGYFTFR